jgi:pimeloyl-ACP methyl ester carboxylesterase
LTTVALLLIVSAVVAQDPPVPPVPAPAAKGAMPANPKDNAKTPSRRTSPRVKAPGAGVAAKTPRKAVDPLANPVVAAEPNAPAEKTARDPNAPLPPPGTFHYRFKISSEKSQPLAATYYPSKYGMTAPVIMLIHERDRSGRDFEEPMTDLKGMSLAESLQKTGFAVMIPDLRGHGANPRRALARDEWSKVPEDVQLAYLALIDRNNWGDLNVSKLGVVALGEGANVAITWAAGGGGVSGEGRASDLSALVLLSPMVDAQSQGLRAGPPLTTMASRAAMALLVGERDAASFELVDSIKGLVRRQRNNVVETFPSALHGYKLFRLEPNLTAVINQFLETHVRGRADEWEGRYLLTPVTYTDIKVIPNPVRVDPATKKAEP